MCDTKRSLARDRRQTTHRRQGNSSIPYTQIGICVRHSESLKSFPAIYFRAYRTRTGFLRITTKIVQTNRNECLLVHADMHSLEQLCPNISHNRTGKVCLSSTTCEFVCILDCERYSFICHQHRNIVVLTIHVIPIIFKCKSINHVSCWDME